MNTAASGQLIIRPVRARISHNTEWFGKMDPYLQFEFEGQTKKGQVCYKGGTQPTWGDTITFSRIKGYLLYIRLWDFQRFKSHDLIASDEINISEVFQTGFKDMEVELFHEGKTGAVVKMSFQFRSHNLGQQPNTGQLTSMMDSRRNSRIQPPMPAQMGGFQGYNNPISMNGNGIYPSMGIPIGNQQQNPNYPIGNVRPPENFVGNNPYQPANNNQPMYEQQKQNTMGMGGGSMMRPPNKQTIQSSNSISQESSNNTTTLGSTKNINKKYTAEEMDALLE